MAAALLRRHLELDGMCDTVSSAGLLREGAPASPGALAAMEARGIDLSAHRSAVLSQEMLANADLIIGMAREHVREAVVLAPSAWPASFTLKELVRRGSDAGRRGAHERIADWLARLHEGRELSELMGASPTDDVADPIGMDDAAYEATTAELEQLIVDLVGLVWGARARVGSRLASGRGGLAPQA
jgi:protein-tyrosine phosphatase